MKPPYKYMKHGTMWCVYKMTYHQQGETGSKISEHFTSEEAKKETYRLNGWK